MRRCQPVALVFQPAAAAHRKYPLWISRQTIGGPMGPRQWFDLSWGVRSGSDCSGVSLFGRNRSGIQSICAAKEMLMIIVGIVLLVLGFILAIPILWSIGIIVLVVGLIFELLGATGRAVGGRRHYY